MEEFRDYASGEYVVTDSQVEALVKRTGELEGENREMRELVEAQAKQLKELERQVASLEEGEHPVGDAELVDAGENQEKQRPRQRESGLADAWVVGVENQAGEEYALAPATPLVEEWRALRSGSTSACSRVDRAKTALCRWKLEIELLRETLPPETELLDDSRRADHIQWRLEALAEARRELAKAVRVRWLRRVVTLGLWWR